MSFGNTRLLIFILVLLGTDIVYNIISDVFKFTQPAPYLKETGHPNAVERKRSAYLLILVQLRTGSSFLGQLFNQHPGVFDLYEPLHTFSMFQTLNYVTEKSHATLVVSFLRSLSRCSLNDFQVTSASFLILGFYTRIFVYQANRCRPHPCANLKLRRLTASQRFSRNALLYYCGENFNKAFARSDF